MDMETKEVILSRLLPKTGQSAVYRAGDDGTHQAGWWQGKEFEANLTRFIAKTIDGDNVVIDRASGLMWAADGDAAGCNNGDALDWDDAIDYANALDFAGFTDWRIPNKLKLLSLIKCSAVSPMTYTSDFPNTQESKYWTSTTWAVITSFAWYVDFADACLNVQAKTETSYLRCVRGGL